MNVPADHRAERAILGAILIDQEAYYEAAAELAADDFHLDSHRRIFRLFESMASEQLDIVTVSSALSATGQTDAIGGLAYLSSLTEGLPRRLGIRPYCRQVREKSKLRQILSLGERYASLAADGESRSMDLVEGIQESLQSILGEDRDDSTVKSFTVGALDRFREERKGLGSGISYGVGRALDEFTGGMRAGEVTVVGARSGVGKTALMCQAAAANARVQIPVALFSLEMTREQILRRLWSIESRVPYKRVTDPWLANVAETENVHDAAMRIAEWPLQIFDREDLTLAKILALARIAIRRRKVRFIAVDYAQEVDAPGRDERAKVMMVCRRLTQLVKHEDCSLMLLSQLTKIRREDYARAPVVGDLIESGKLENVAHLVLLLHRGWDEERRRLDERAELIVPKQRRGETGVLEAVFDRRTATFEAR